MLAALVLGAASALAARVLLPPAALEAAVAWATEPAGKIFLRLLFMLVIPLIVSALALGVTGLGDLKRLGRIGLKTLLYTVVVSSIAVLIGVAMVNLFRPGSGLSPELKQRLATLGTAAPPAAPASGASGVDFLVGLVPNNIVKTMAEFAVPGAMVAAVL